MRRILMFLALSAVLPPAPLFAQDSLTAGLRSCAAIVGSVERLSCYDQLARRPLPAPLPAPMAAPAQMSQRPAPAADFGADTLPQPAPVPVPRSSLESITSPVTDFSFDVRGHFIVTLANGQIWRQIEGDTVNVTLRKDRTHTATVSRAILGSYSIRFDNPRGLFKVLRVR
jgi:hypothetical protein